MQIRTTKRDRYGRTVAELYVGKQSVNLQMVKEGQAVVYRQYLSGGSTTKDQYLQAEAQAKKQRLGFWNQQSPVMPCDYRRGKRSSNPQVSTKVAPSVQTQSLSDCINSDCNCNDFKTQVQAQQVLNAFGEDKYRLDGDKNGVACESLLWSKGDRG